MNLFKPKKPEYPKMPRGDVVPVLRCSICTGEQTLCAMEQGTGRLHELMLIRDQSELEGFCRENGFDPGEIKKVY